VGCPAAPTRSPMAMPRSTALSGLTNAPGRVTRLSGVSGVVKPALTLASLSNSAHSRLAALGRSVVLLDPERSTNVFGRPVASGASAVSHVGRQVYGVGISPDALSLILVVLEPLAVPDREDKDGT
jgi:hypothetical protein